jgi:cytidine deaminase
MKVDKIVQEAFQIASSARKNAYANHSKVKVGAALKTKGSDKIYSGCNVEFIINGISTCAERNAIGQVVTDQGAFELEFVVVCSNTEPALYPCGVCLQSMSEFCDRDLPIYVANKDGIIAQTKFSDLLTHQYSSLPKVLPE